MLINWFTVFAQVLNFLILVALLRWFLYKPILKVMHKRQMQLEDRWQEAERLQAEAQQALITYQQQQQELPPVADCQEAVRRGSLGVDQRV